jgi:hypothetical protein
MEAMDHIMAHLQGQLNLVQGQLNLMQGWKTYLDSQLSMLNSVFHAAQEAIKKFSQAANDENGPMTFCMMESLRSNLVGVFKHLLISKHSWMMMFMPNFLILLKGISKTMWSTRKLSIATEKLVFVLTT